MKPVKHNMSTSSKSGDLLKPLPPNAWLSLRPNQQDLQKDCALASGNPPALPGNIFEKTKTFAEKLKQTKVTSKMQVNKNYSANERYAIDPKERRGLTSSESSGCGQANANCGSKDIIKTNACLSFPNRNIQNYNEVDNNPPIVHDQSKDPDKLPTIPKKELTEEELELMREKRRERRKREKEKKKMLKEQKKRAEVYAPKSSKINVVSADTLLRSGIGSSVNTTMLKEKNGHNCLTVNPELVIKNEYDDKASASPIIVKPKTIRFLDDEYPTLASVLSDHKASTKLNSQPKASSEDVKSKSTTEKTCSKLSKGGYSYGEHESASEWETDDDDSFSSEQKCNARDELQYLNAPLSNLDLGDTSCVELQFKDNFKGKPILQRKNSNYPNEHENGGKLDCSAEPKSWSNIVRFSRASVTTRQSVDKMNSDLNTTSKRNEGRLAISKNNANRNKDEILTIKKVKKKDPITLDLLQAIQIPKKNTKVEKRPVLGSKIAVNRTQSCLTQSKKIQQSKDPSLTKVQTVRNALDSTAPTIRRGKEREKPKKRRPTKMRKIIAAERAAKSKVSMLPSTQIEIERSEIHNAIEIEPEKKYNQTVSNHYPVLSKSESNVLKPLENTDTSTMIETIPVFSTQLESKRSTEVATELLNETPASIGACENENYIIEQAKKSIHTKKFKAHCNHILSKELDTHAALLLKDLVRFQDKKFAEDPVKAKARRRYVVGLRETTKYMKVNKVVCLFIAPDIDNIESKGGLNDMTTNLIQMAANTGEYGEKKTSSYIFCDESMEFGENNPTESPGSLHRNIKLSRLRCQFCFNDGYASTFERRISGKAKTCNSNATARTLT